MRAVGEERDYRRGETEDMRDQERKGAGEDEDREEEAEKNEGLEG